MRTSFAPGMARGDALGVHRLGRAVLAAAEDERRRADRAEARQDVLAVHDDRERRARDAVAREAVDRADPPVDELRLARARALGEVDRRELRVGEQPCGIPKRRPNEMKARYLTLRRRSSASAFVSRSASARTRCGCCSARRMRDHAAPREARRRRPCRCCSSPKASVSASALSSSENGGGTSLLPCPGPSKTTTRPSAESGSTWCFHMPPSKRRLGQRTIAGSPGRLATPRSS